MNRFLPVQSGSLFISDPLVRRDIALLVARLILGVVLFAHGWQKLVISGIAGTYGQFDNLGIPLAIVSASFVTVVEFVGGALLVLGAMTTVVVLSHLVVMIGASLFVHISNGIFAQDGGWELVGIIACCELMLAVNGAGRLSLDHVVKSAFGQPRAPRRPVVVDANDDTSVFPAQSADRRPVVDFG